MRAESITADRSHHPLRTQAIFTAECALKIVAQGEQPRRYFRDRWNVFDFSIVLLGYLEATATRERLFVAEFLVTPTKIILAIKYTVMQPHETQSLATESSS